jgi:hypothetical protein
MGGKRLFLVVPAIIFFAAAGLAQDQSLAVSSHAPKTDGVLNADEYSYVKDAGKMKVYLDRNADTLFVGVVGNTSGWVAVGLGSPRMNESDIFMGFVLDGKVQFKPQLGVGHSHRDDTSLSDTVVSYAMKSENGKTTLELALKASSYMEKGQAALDLIYAMGSQASFTAMHSFFGSLEIPLK